MNEAGEAAPDIRLLRAIESGISASPRAVRSAYSAGDLVNSIWLLLRSRGVRNPSRLQIRSAAIDVHRRDSHYTPHFRLGLQRRRKPSVEFMPDIPERPVNGVAARQDLADHLRDVRRRFGTDGLAMFLLSRVMELPARAVAEILDYAPDSALARSVAEMGAGL